MVGNETPCSSRSPFTAKLKSINAIVKVVQASVSKAANGKLEFQKKGQAFVNVNEKTANVHYITSVIQKKWGEEYVLVTDDG